MSRPSMPRRGGLQKLSVSRLLQTIRARNLSGCLSVSRGKITRRLYFKEGMITYATSTERCDRLGEIFIAQGLLTKAEVDDALKQGSPLRRVGMVLLVEGKVTPQELFQGVSAQVVTILERMRSWRKGDFEFENGREPEPGTVLLRIPLALYLGPARKGEGLAPAKSEGGEADERPPPGLQIDEDEESDGEEVFEVMEPPYDDAAGESVPPGLQFDDDEEELTPDELFAGDEEGEEDDEVPAETPAGGEPVDGTGPMEMEKLTEEITFQVQELRGRLSGGPYKLLGLKPTATYDEVQESFNYFARLLHPKQLPKGLPGELAGAAADLYRKVAAAFEEAGEKARRQRKVPAAPFGRTLRGAPVDGAIDTSDGARRAYFRARTFMDKGNYWQAVAAMRDAVRNKPEQPEYRNLLGFCLVQTGRRLHEAEEHIKEAIRLDPGNAEYVANLGLAYKAGRSYKKARNMFQQALLYDKNNVLSKKEIRDLPREVERSNRSKSFWDRMFGK